MDIKNFIEKFENHPILFIGTGMSLRYMNKSYTWDDLLKKISFELYDDNEKYLDIKSENCVNGKYHYEKIASKLESIFNDTLKSNRNGNFKEINDIFYKNMENEVNLSRFKIYISEIFKNMDMKEDKIDEISALKRARKNIGSVITTNYDKFIESIFEFNPLVGNEILLSNPYGSVYKIHGCVDHPQKIIITDDDYHYFEEKYELIRAQLLSIFIHNPIIFLGYSVGDENIKKLLKTIYSYIEPNSKIAEKIRSNFLLVEFENGSGNLEVLEHDMVLDENTTIRINKLKTDNYFEIYDSISILQLPVSAMDVRKVQNIVKEIYSGGKIEVSITEDVDKLNNDNKVLVIGSKNTIKYIYQTTSEMMINYFNIIEESNSQLLQLIDRQKVQNNQYFPIYGFSTINTNIKKTEELKNNQYNKLKQYIDKKMDYIEIDVIDDLHIKDILECECIPKTKRCITLMISIMNKNVDLYELEDFLKKYDEKNTTEYRKLLCAYDYMRFSVVGK